MKIKSKSSFVRNNTLLLKKKKLWKKKYANPVECPSSQLGVCIPTGLSCHSQLEQQPVLPMLSSSRAYRATQTLYRPLDTSRSRHKLEYSCTDKVSQLMSEDVQSRTGATPKLAELSKGKQGGNGDAVCRDGNAPVNTGRHQRENRRNPEKQDGAELTRSRESEHPDPKLVKEARKTSLLNGRNLEQDQPHIGEGSSCQWPAG